MKPKVFLTRLLPEPGMDLLRSHVSLTAFPHDRPITKEELLEQAAGIEGLLCLLTDKIDRQFIASAPNLKVISNYAVGYDNIDLAAAKERGIAVTNTPGVLTEATADLAFALLIDAARRISESDRWLRENTFTGWAPMLFTGMDLWQRTLGIAGAGRIGRALAHRAHHGFGMKILYFDRDRNADFETEFSARFVDKETLLREADFISLHVPLTPDTRHFIGAAEFNLMKPTAVLINTARGPVVDEQALIEALRERRIFGAGLDVYEQEPLVPQALKELPNVVILPHIGSASVSTREKMAVMAAQNLIDVLEGEEPANRIRN